jgi:hypothetical protein
MPARAPLDVDLEDKLLYGLTPMRLGYVVLALLSAFALWSSVWAATPVRAAACVVVLLGGATLAWGRWRGRAVDGWLMDSAAFTARTQRVVWNESWADRLRRRPWPWSPPVAVVVEANEGEWEASGETKQLAFPDAAIAAS